MRNWRATRSSGQRRAMAALAAVALVVAVAGCTSPFGGGQGGSGASDTSELSLEEAKAQTIEVRDEMAALYPAEDIAEIRANETSKALMPCGGEESFAWPGRTTITVAGTVDKAEALAPIAEAWEGREGWTVEHGTSSKGFPKLVLNHSDGTHVNIAYFYDGTELWVDAVSPCFTLPGGLTLGGEY